MSKGILFKPGFLPYLTVLIFNVVVDVGHKITLQNTVFKVYSGPEQVILISIINGLILLPFVLLMTPAGFLTEKFAKPTIMRVTAFMGVLFTGMIVVSYYQGWYGLAFIMTLLLAVQSAVYSPSKYGYIRELLPQRDVGPGNGWVQAATIIAILVSTFAFSFGFESFYHQGLVQTESQILLAVAPLSWLLLAFAAVEFYLSFRLPERPAPNASAKFDWSAYVKGRALLDNLKRVTQHKTIFYAVIGISLIMGFSQAVLATFPDLAKSKLGITNAIVIQGMLASAGIGVLIGALTAGRLCKPHVLMGLVPLGALGFAASLTIVAAAADQSILIVGFIGLGFFSSWVLVPLHATVQLSVTQQLGSVLAASNWFQNTVMLGFLCLTVLLSLYGLNSQVVFSVYVVCVVVLAVVAVFKMNMHAVTAFLTLCFTFRYRVEANGTEHVPAKGAVLLLGNHVSFIDWAIIHIACPRDIRYVIHENYYSKWYLLWFMRYIDAVPISATQSKKAIRTVVHLLEQGEVVCLFPEGKISTTGEISPFKKGFELILKQVDALVVSFYLGGLFGSVFSKDSRPLRLKLRAYVGRRHVPVSFAAPQHRSTDASSVYEAVSSLKNDEKL